MSKGSNDKGDNTSEATLYLALELGDKKWKLGFTIRLGQSPRRRTITAGDLGALEAEIGLAKKGFVKIEKVSW